MTIDVFLQSAIRSAVRLTRKRFHQWIEEDEAFSEAWVWALEHAPTVERYYADNAEGNKRGFFRLRTELSRAIERAARTAKAAATGYDPTDESFWSSAAVCASLRAWASDQHLYPGQSLSGASTARTDPAEGGNLAAGVVDVQRAWESSPLTSLERMAVESHGVWEETWEETATRLGCEVGETRGHFRRGMNKLLNFLGGENPWTAVDDELRKRPGAPDEAAQIRDLMS